MIVDGYIRVSQVRGRGGDSFISPVVQREQIEAWAALNGSAVGVIFEELDRSGASWNRPMLAEAIERVERGLSDGIVVAKLDRFGRSLVESLQAIQRVRDAGGTFVAVRDGLDLNTETGRLALRIMLSTAEWQLDHIREQWRTARASAVGRGVHAGARPPFGYVRDERSRRLRPHRTQGPVVTELFARRAAGATLAGLAAFLDDAGVPTVDGGVRWWSTTLSLILRNRVYLGELRNGDLVNVTAHPALTDPVTWQAAQAPRRLGAVPHGTPALLAGLVRCASCGRRMTTKPLVRGGRRSRAYSCGGGDERARCSGRAHISAGLVEPHVEAAFFELADLPPRDRTPGEIAALETELAAATASLVAYRDDPRVAAALGADRFIDGLELRARRERRALLRLDAERRRTDVPALLSAAAWEERWPSMTVADRRRAIAALIDCVVVRPGTDPVRERVLIARRREGPVDLPTATGPLRQIEQAEGRWFVPTTRRRWDDRRVAREVRAFVGAARAWPSDAAFTASGHGPLLREIELSGGPHRWARKLDLAPPPARTRGYWTDERISAALAAVVEDLGRRPTRRDFARLGLDGLHGAMGRRARVGPTVTGAAVSDGAEC